jgi:hypothetical protein
MTLVAMRHIWNKPAPASSPAQPTGPGSPPAGAEADALRFADLPPPNTKRWVTRRKAEVVAAVRNGVISLDEACHRYKLSIEEFASWQALIDNHGLAGLRATRVQDYRKTSKNKP